MGGSPIVKWFRRWGIAAAVATALIGGAFGIATAVYVVAERMTLEYEMAAAQKAEAYAHRARIEAQTRCALLPPQDKRECVREEVQAARQGQHDEYDLQAQLVTSAWTRAMGIAALVAMFFGMIGVGLVYLTFSAQRRSNRIAVREYARSRLEARNSTKGAAEAIQIAARNADAAIKAAESIVAGNSIALKSIVLEQRGWLYPRITSFDRYIFSERGIQIDFTYVIQNLGKTHTNMIFSVAELTSMNFWEMRERMDDVLPRLAQSQQSTLIFPGEESKVTQLAMVKAEDLNVSGDDSIVGLTLIIALFYRTAVDEEIRRTVRCYDVFSTNEHGNITSIKYGQEILANRLRYVPNRHGNVAT